MIEIANIFIWKDKAYLPVLGKTEVGFFWDTAKLLTADATVESMTSALEEIVAIGNPPILHPSQAEFRKLTPVQRATGMRSWKKMAQAGMVCCVLTWTRDRVSVAFSPQGAKDIQEINYKDQKEFTADCSLRDVATYILKEIDSRQRQR